MNDFMTMAVFHCTYDLLEELAGFCIIATASLHQVIEQFSLCIFQYHNDIGFG
jgi:hypothetical protein